MAYATLSELRAYLKQAPTGATADADLGHVLDRATSTIDTYLGFSFAAFAAAAGKRVISDKSEFLFLPVCSPDTSPAIDGIGDFEIRRTRGRCALWRELKWPDRAYTVQAVWGYGSAPESVIEVCLELAVNIWRQKDRGMFTDVIGVDSPSTQGSGVIVGFRGAFTHQQRAILDALKAKYADISV